MVKTFWKEIELNNLIFNSSNYNYCLFYSFNFTINILNIE